MDNYAYFSTELNKTIQGPLKHYSSNKKINELKKKFKHCSSFKNFKKIFEYYSLQNFKCNFLIKNEIFLLKYFITKFYIMENNQGSQIE